MFFNRPCRQSGPKGAEKPKNETDECRFLVNVFTRELTYRKYLS